jgi:hypothetical protein
MGHNGAVVLGSKLIAQLQCACFAVLNYRDDDDENGDGKNHRSNNDLGIREIETHELMIHFVLLCGIDRDCQGLVMQVSGVGGSMICIMRGRAEGMLTSIAQWAERDERTGIHLYLSQSP